MTDEDTADDLDPIIDDIQQAIIDLEEDKTGELTQEALDKDLNPLVILQEGLTEGVRTVGDKFGRGEVFLPELAMSADCMRSGVELVEPLLDEMDLADEDTAGKVIMGTVDEDIHNIGKNILITMLKANGFDVVDLGVEIPNEDFVQAVKDEEPDILGMSALMTMTMDHQEEVIELLEEEGVRDDIKVMVGGAPTSEEWRDEIGADGYADNADAAVEEATDLLAE
ncbi:methyltransferase cognate corrinoid protein [Halodesulfurarchaeum sp.]|uniref:methyltransferase cognate corrinoid protein n=1 Tax=Halodesulfurarchaeum sp. TaxID=1980530 RepID=UPI001BBC51D9|nr:methyltransferase cognate corrinoid protein [Halodesulfurarchaeum sp.]